MPRYSGARRQAVMTKPLPPQSLAPQVIAEQEGISLGTVYKWRKEVRAEGRCLTCALGKSGTVSLNPERELEIAVEAPENRWLE